MKNKKNELNFKKNKISIVNFILSKIENTGIGIDNDGYHLQKEKILKLTNENLQKCIEFINQNCPYSYLKINWFKLVCFINIHCQKTMGEITDDLERKSKY